MEGKGIVQIHHAASSAPIIMSIPFQSFWYGDPLGPRERVCLASFVQRGHPFHLYCYEPLSVPDGVELKDASEICSEDEVVHYDAETSAVAAFADLFRYKLLYEKGGWWVDMDVIYTGHALPQEAPFFGRMDAREIANGILYVEPGSVIMRRCLEQATQVGHGASWASAGPKLLTDVLQAAGRAHEAAPQSYAYPMYWKEALDVYRPSRKRFVEERIERANAPFLHLWNSKLVEAGVQDTIAPPEGSYLSHVAEEVGVEWPHSEPRYQASAIDWMAHHFRRSHEYPDLEAKLHHITSSRTWKLVAVLQRILGREPMPKSE